MLHGHLDYDLSNDLTQPSRDKYRDKPLVSRQQKGQQKQNRTDIVNLASGFTANLVSS